MFHSSSSSSTYYSDPVFYNPLSSSLPSNNYFMHRSGSTQSFTDHHHQGRSFPNPASSAFLLSPSPPPTNCELLDFHPDPVRRVFSTGDLQASTESCTPEGVATGGRVGRYSAEERTRRIERYRSKRNQRNFHKKITYACRKTLADSRPRVRGRFARNGETDPETEAEAEASESGYVARNNRDEGNCGSRGNYDNDGGDVGGDWWTQMQAALLADEGDEECSYDDDFWASLDNVFAMNLLS